MVVNPAEAMTCRRCSKEAPRMESPPYPGPLGAEVQSAVCARCWEEWQRAEIMVINELRLDFMNPESQRVLEGHMLEFLNLPAAEAGE